MSDLETKLESLIAAFDAKIAEAESYEEKAQALRDESKALLPYIELLKECATKIKEQNELFQNAVSKDEVILVLDEEKSAGGVTDESRKRIIDALDIDEIGAEDTPTLQDKIAS